MLPWQTDIVRDTANGSGMPVIVTAVYFTLHSNLEEMNMLANRAYLTVTDDELPLHGFGPLHIMVDGSLSGRKRESDYCPNMISQLIN